MKTIKDVTKVDYSEKAVIAIGNTKPIKDQLKAIGGRFSMWLKTPKGEPYGASWIFSKALASEALDLVLSGLPEAGQSLFERKLAASKAAKTGAKTNGAAKPVNGAAKKANSTKETNTQKQKAKQAAITDISPDEFKAFQQFKQFLAMQPA